jgi:hypothetical protein
VIIVVESGLRRRPAIPDISEEDASARCSVSPGKEGPRGWIMFVGVDLPVAAGAGDGAAAGVVVVVVVVEDEVVGEASAAFIRSLPAAAVILFI